METPIFWIGHLDSDQLWDFVLSIVFLLIALFGCYANISFMCPLFRYRKEHLQIPSVRFIFHISLADLLFAAFTAFFLILKMISSQLAFPIQYFLFYLFPYLIFVVEFFIILLSLEQFSEVCTEDYDREIRIRDCRRQPLVVWLAPVVIIVAVLLTPYEPRGSNYIFPVVMVCIFLFTFGVTFIYIFVIRRMNLDLHRQELMDETRSCLLQRNRLIIVHLTMTVVFLGLTSVGVILQMFNTGTSPMAKSRGWFLTAGSLGLLNSIVKPIIYVAGTSFYRDIYIRKKYVQANNDDGPEENA